MIKTLKIKSVLSRNPLTKSKLPLVRPKTFSLKSSPTVKRTIPWKIPQKHISFHNNNFRSFCTQPRQPRSAHQPKLDIASAFNNPALNSNVFYGPSHGLMDLDHFKSPHQLMQHTETTLETSRKLALQIMHEKCPPQKTISRLDNLSETLCSIADPGNFIRQVHPNVHWQNAADQAVNAVSMFIHELNTTPELYQKVVEVWTQGELLDQEEKTIVRQLKSEFELNGIHLPPKLRLKVVQLQERISLLGDQFINEMQSPQSSRVIKIPLDQTTLSFEEARKWKHLLEIRNNEVSFSTSPNILSSITQHIPDETIRKTAYIASTYQFPKNVQTTENLVNARHQLAQLMNYKSASDMKTSVTNNRCLKNPQQVFEFLHEVSKQNQQKVQEELRILKEEKAKFTGEADPTIHAWDKDFYIKMTKTKEENQLRKARDYFSVGAGFYGLQIICESLFGIHLNVVPPKKGEIWHPSVRKIEVTDEAEGLIGYVYADLFPRPGKLHQNATFNLEFPRANDQGLFKIARLALNCNLEGDHNTKPNEPTLLSPTEMETLFHEFGHCLHSLLSRTKYQHAAGTRAPLDFVETPSTLMENFVWDYRSVKRFAKHWKTGEVLPQKDLDLLQKERNQFSGLYLQDQICYALFDQQLHAQNPPKKSPTELFYEILSEHSPIQPVHGGHFYTRFSHLTNYDTGYYCYPLCQAFSKDIWDSCFQADPLSREVGSKYRQRLLQFGGSVDPLQLIKDLIGDKANEKIYQ